MGNFSERIRIFESIWIEFFEKFMKIEQVFEKSGKKMKIRGKFAEKDSRERVDWVTLATPVS
jgi:hypothetical protein